AAEGSSKFSQLAGLLFVLVNEVGVSTFEGLAERASKHEFGGGTVPLLGLENVGSRDRGEVLLGDAGEEGLVHPGNLVGVRIARAAVGREEVVVGSHGQASFGVRGAVTEFLPGWAAWLAL